MSDLPSIVNMFNFFGQRVLNAIVITADVGILFFSTTSDPHMGTFPPSPVISRGWT
jgi:hypothetical protein